MATSNERTMGVVAHVAPLFLGFGVLGWAVAFVILLMQREKSHFVTRHAIQSLTFQFVLSLWMFISIILVNVPVVGFIGGITLAIGGMAGLVLTVMGAIHAARGEDYEYPIVGRLYRRSIG